MPPDFKKHILRRSWLPFLILLVLSGCVRSTNLGCLKGVQDAAVDEAWQQLTQRWKEFGAYEGQMVIRGKLMGRRIRARPYFLFSYPDRLYLEVGSSGLGPMAIVASAGGRVTMVFPNRREYLEEEATAQVLERLIGIPLGAEELVALLVGSGIPTGSYQVEPDRKPDGRSAFVLAAASADLYRRAEVRVTCEMSPKRATLPASRGLSGQGKGGTAEVLGPSYRIEGGWISLIGHGTGRLRFRYERWMEGGILPGRIDFRQKGLIKLRIRLLDVSYRGQDQDPSLFEIPVSMGARRLKLSDFRDNGPVLLEAFR